MSTGDELTAFVTARLDEDEAAARRNIGTTGLGDTEEGGPSFPDYQTYDGDDIAAACGYLNQFRPLRTLREVAAKRAILAEYESFRATFAEARASAAGVGPGVHTGAIVLGDAVSLLAAAWSDHPDYRQEWAP